MKKKKVCLIASSGGHYEQILMLSKLSKDFDVYFVTEKTQYNGNEERTYYLKQVNRRELKSVFYQIVNMYNSFKIIIKENPDTIISTGALSTIPTLIIGKILKKQIIFIESFAKSDSATLTGKLVYKFADLFIVQWKDMKKIYPKAIFLGSIY